MSRRASIAVVGIGADGWPGLAEGARAAVHGATTIIGSDRQLALLPDSATARRQTLPSPLEGLVDELERADHDGICVLASGDPMLHGIGATLARRLGPERLDIHPHPSAFAVACARLGWAAADVQLVSAVARAPEVVARVLQPGRRIIVYVSGTDGARTVARVLTDRGYGSSRLVVLECLGAEDERISEATAAAYDRPADPLHLVAIEVAPAPGTPVLPLVPGLRDDAYDSDGQLTKREVRAVTLAALAPTPHAVLWDVGAGSGSVSIEWLRAEPTAEAYAIEARDDRADRIERNARALGVPDRLTVVRGTAPGALDEIPAPAVVFIGGGVTVPGVLERCWSALPPHGRIVANTVTLEGEQRLVAACAEHGGTLTRVEVSRAAPIGTFTGWRPQMPVVQWAATTGEPRP